MSPEAGIEVTSTSVTIGAVLVPAVVTVPDEGYAALVRLLPPLSSSVKLTLNLTFLPTSSVARV